MKKSVILLYLLSLFFKIGSNNTQAQSEIPDLLTSGASDVETYLMHYTQPAAESLIYNLSNNWFYSAKVKKGSFYISFLGSGVKLNDSDKKFLFNPAQYENLSLSNNSQAYLPTLIGGETDHIFEIETTNPDGTTETLQLYVPEGLLSDNLNYLPIIYPQVSFTLFKGTQLKGMYLPPLKFAEFRLKTFSIGLQHELTTWLKNSDNTPIAVSLLGGYRSLDLSYAFLEEDLEYTDGDYNSMRLALNTDVFTFATIASTNFKVINLYGSIGWVSGKTDLGLHGRYIPEEGVEQSNLLENPVQSQHKLSGVKYNLGTSLKLGPVLLQADFNKYNRHTAYSVGLHFGK